MNEARTIGKRFIILLGMMAFAGAAVARMPGGHSGNRNES